MTTMMTTSSAIVTIAPTAKIIIGILLTGGFISTSQSSSASMPFARLSMSTPSMPMGFGLNVNSTDTKPVYSTTSPSRPFPLQHTLLLSASPLSAALAIGPSSSLTTFATLGAAIKPATQ